jgi:hypothetical protein
MGTGFLFCAAKNKTKHKQQKQKIIRFNVYRL